MEKLCLTTCVCVLMICAIPTAVTQETTTKKHSWDERGYILFCLCMGRFGNQVDHFLGGLAFAKDIDRTLVLPPWRTYKNIPFTDWFRLDVISKYHRVILAEDFMTSLAPEHWPPGNRTGFCFSYRDQNCNMKQGNPFGPFWDGLEVDFDAEETFSISYSEIEQWKARFPSSKYPVVALKGAPATFPLLKKNWHLQKYLQWSDKIVEEGQQYIRANFPEKSFLGIHLRNGNDWKNACEHVVDTSKYMASPQCIEPDSGKNITRDICFPSTREVLRLTKDIIQKTGLKVIYIATDKNPLIKELEDHLAEDKVQIFHQDPWLPQIDVYILGQSDHFIGNCVSSFTSVVTRERAVNNKPNYFWGMGSGDL